MLLHQRRKSYAIKVDFVPMNSGHHSIHLPPEAKVSLDQDKELNMCEQDHRSTLERGDEIERNFYRLKAQEWACEPDTVRKLIEAAMSRPAPTPAEHPADEMYRCIHDAITPAPAAEVTGERFIDIVFDGPPSHKSGRFVEVENSNGQSIRAGKWIDRGSGLWALRISHPSPDAGRVPEAERAKIIEECAEVADRVKESDEGYATRYPDERRRYEDRAHRAGTIAAAIRTLALPAPPPAEGGQKT
jgi:hypothetical protein